MPTITLGLPTPATVVSAGLHSANYAAIQALLNGGLDNSNISGAANLDAVARHGVRINSAGSTFNRRRLNLIAGAGISLAIADDSAGEEVDVTIASAGSTTYRRVTQTSVVNTTTETDLFGSSITLGAGVMSTNKVAHVLASGDIINNSGSNHGSPRWRLKLGGTAIMDTDTIAAAWRPNATRGKWFLRAEIINLTANSQAVIFELHIYAEWDNIAISQLFSVGSGDVEIGGRGGDSSGATAAIKLSWNRWTGLHTVAIDTTTDKLLEFTVQMATAHTNTDVRLDNALVEVV